jgi:tetratricopeptide (TPR) repeat protein
MILLFRGDGQSALEWAGRRIGLLRSMARRDPRNLAIARRELSGALAERAETCTRLGHLTEALADFKEAFELAHDIGNREEELFRALHALTKARLGDLSELALLGQRVRDIVKAGTGQGGETIYNYWMFWYDAACVHAALAQLELQDQAKPPAQRQQLAQRDLERALEYLGKAGAAGEFKGTIRLDELRREPLLDPLRSHPRFQVLLMDLAFPDSPLGQRLDQDKHAAVAR